MSSTKYHYLKYLKSMHTGLLEEGCLTWKKQKKVDVVF